MIVYSETKSIILKPCASKTSIKKCQKLESEREREREKERKESSPRYLDARGD